MNPKIIFFTLLIIAIVLEVLGDFYFKKWSIDNKKILIITGFVFYALGSLFWAASLKYELLSKAGVIFMMANILLVTFLGLFYFQEELTLINKIGIALGMISIILIEI